MPALLVAVNRSADGRRGGRVVYANAQAATHNCVLKCIVLYMLLICSFLEDVLGRTDLSGRLEDLQFFASLFGFLFFKKNI
jgi:hypothetical protein